MDHSELESKIVSFNASMNDMLSRMKGLAFQDEVVLGDSLFSEVLDSLQARHRGVILRRGPKNIRHGCG